ncbi:5-amino-6-(D-ribitylamino)uracil--L-tyrosine 4-hydroxyphenyl transferase CofH [Haliangium sp.]|uniref:5-amino-6-(D-ribitylamino)uracil--L-tyrosine 4-hydroxyphenyl transferase CofH n=1 Tax=Haliangium sp. TaxID=2663208 RepID=UPI003D0C59EC
MSAGDIETDVVATAGDADAAAVNAALIRAQAALDQVEPGRRALLAACLDGRPLTWAQGVELSGLRGPELAALAAVADAVRARQVGEVVTYVTNRNINFTNVCVKHCKFCAFSRDLRSEQGYFLDADEVIRRAREAYELGATEVCLQAGLAPDTDGRYYIELCRAVHAALPGLHIHGFSPEEVKYGALRAHMSVRDYLAALIDAGLGSMPGTSAEILDDELRARIAPGRITTEQWIEVVTTAHALGLRTTSTMMYGHVETPAQRLRHLDLLRSIQRDTGGFTEFVPLSFVPTHTPMFTSAQVPGLRPGPTADEVIEVHALARLMLGDSVRNIQIAWVKQGTDAATRLLACGGNDLGGTLLNESISTAAGADHGQRRSPRALRQVIRAAGRVPAQRSTGYDIVRRFDRDDPSADELLPLDDIGDDDGRFGSYQDLAADPAKRFHWPR